MAKDSNKKLPQGVGCVLLIILALITLAAGILPICLLIGALVYGVRAHFIRLALRKDDNDFLLHADEKEQMAALVTKLAALQSKWDALNMEGTELGLQVTANDTFSKKSYEGKRIASAMETLEGQIEEINLEIQSGISIMQDRWNEFSALRFEYDLTREKSLKALWGFLIWVLAITFFYVLTNKMWLSRPDVFIDSFNRDGLFMICWLVIPPALLALIPLMELWERFFLPSKLPDFDPGTVDQPIIDQPTKKQILLQSYFPENKDGITYVFFWGAIILFIIGVYPAFKAFTWMIAGLSSLMVVYYFSRSFSLNHIFKTALTFLCLLLITYGGVSFWKRRVVTASTVVSVRQENTDSGSEPIASATNNSDEVVIGHATPTPDSSVDLAPFQSPPARQLYCVFGLAPGDRLNVHIGPGASKKIIAGLANGYDGITVIGDSVMNDTTEWVNVDFGGGSGWVNRQYIRDDSH